MWATIKLFYKSPQKNISGQVVLVSNKKNRIPIFFITLFISTRFLSSKPKFVSTIFRFI